MRKHTLVMVAVLAVASIALTVCPQWIAFAQNSSAGQSNIEVSITQLNQMVRGTAIARRFLAAANRGDLKAANALCSTKVDPGAPSVGDGDQVIGFRSGSEFRKVWAGFGFRLINVEYQKAQSGKGPYILVWLRPTKGRWDGDTALVYKPSTGKIVSVFDASE